MAEANRRTSRLSIKHVISGTLVHSTATSRMEICPKRIIGVDHDGKVNYFSLPLRSRFSLNFAFTVHTMFCFYCLFCPISILLQTLNSTLYFVLFRAKDDRRAVGTCLLILKVSIIFLN